MSNSQREIPDDLQKQIKILSHFIKVKEIENNELKSENQKIKKEFLLIQQKISDKISRSESLEDLCKDYFQLKEKNELLEKEIISLKDNLSFASIKAEEEKKKYMKKFTAEKANYEDKIQKLNDLVLNYEKIWKTNENQSVEIENLKKDKESLQFEFRNKIDEKNMKYSMHIFEIKSKFQKMVDELQDKMQNLNSDSIDISTKVTMLQNHSLLVELTYLSQEIEKITKKNKELSEKNSFLKRENEILKEIENKILKDREKSLKNAPKGNYSNFENSGINETDHRLIPLISEDKFESSSKLNIIKITKCKIKDILENSKSTIQNAHSIEKTDYSIKNFDSAKKSRNKINKSIENKNSDTSRQSVNNNFLKNSFDCLNDKFAIFKKTFCKYKDLFEGALTFILKTRNITENEITLTSEELSSQNFENLSDEKKSVLVLMILKIIYKSINFLETGRIFFTSNESMTKFNSDINFRLLDLQTKRSYKNLRTDIPNISPSFTYSAVLSELPKINRKCYDKINNFNYK